jgi:hypothetical protein
VNQVFVSYARADRDEASWIAKGLTRHGLKVWMDHLLDSYEDDDISFDKEILRRINECSAIVCFVSSEWASTSFAESPLLSAHRRRTVLFIPEYRISDLPESLANSPNAIVGRPESPDIWLKTARTCRSFMPRPERFLSSRDDSPGFGRSSDLQRASRQAFDAWGPGAPPSGEDPTDFGRGPDESGPDASKPYFHELFGKASKHARPLPSIPEMMKRWREMKARGSSDLSGAREPLRAAGDQTATEKFFEREKIITKNSSFDTDDGRTPASEVIPFDPTRRPTRRD